jgi:phosphatidylglycerophosphate synthase
MNQASSRGPLAGLAALIGLLAVLSATVGIGVAGWLAGVAYGVVLTGTLARGLRRAQMPRLGPANAVTLIRALLVGGVTALVAYSVQRPAPVGVLVALVAVALALDGVDGRVARRTGSTSALGARFDMEIDAFLILVLSVFVAAPLGWWTVAIGAFRYAFVAASWALPWLTAPLAPKFSRKVVAAVQGIVLVVATTGVLPQPLTLAVVALALGSLTWSFGRDIGWLWRMQSTGRRIDVAPVPPAAVAAVVAPLPGGQAAVVPVSPAPAGLPAAPARTRAAAPRLRAVRAAPRRSRRDRESRRHPARVGA